MKLPPVLKLKTYIERFSIPKVNALCLDEEGKARERNAQRETTHLNF